MNTRFKTLVTVVAASLCGLAAAQVKVFDRPPTVEELRKALPAAPAGSGAEGNGPRGRGLIWNQAPAKGDGASGGNAAAAVATAPVAAPQAAEAAGGVVALPINFEPGSSRLTGQGLSYIEPIAQLMKTDPTLRMVVEGHTDASGSAQKNLMLSWDRAMTVFKVLVERYGIEPNRLQPIGKGSQELIDAANPEAANNRRVQFRLLG